MVSSLPDTIDPSVNYFVTNDTLESLQYLCAAHRRRFSIPVIGITGSNGKTIVKEWLYQLLREDYTIVRSPKSFNSQVGVPLSVWQMDAEHELGIFEAGISRPGEMDNLETIIHPSIGVLTNIGQAHDENFSGLNEKVRQKLKLFRNAESLVYCRDYLVINDEILASEELKNKTLFTWSRKGRASLVVGKIARNGH